MKSSRPVVVPTLVPLMLRWEAIEFWLSLSRLLHSRLERNTMRYVCACLLLCSALFAAAQEGVPKAEVFGGYSYLHIDTQGITGSTLDAACNNIFGPGTCPPGSFGVHPSANGWNASARRVLPLSVRARNMLRARWEATGRPDEGWLWSAPTRSGHFEKSTLKKQHKKALRLSKVRPFVLYSLCHTFLTRLGESGCDAWTLARGT